MVYPILVTAPFPQGASAERKKFMDDLTEKFIDDMMCGPEDDNFYDFMQFHPYKASSPVPPSQLYDLLQRELDFFPKYIEGQRNVNGMIQTISLDPREERDYSHPPPRYSGEWGDRYENVKWNNDRVAIIADDTMVHPKTEPGGEKRDMMTVIIVEVDLFQLRNEESEEVRKSLPEHMHELAGRLLDRSPQWCKERAIAAMRADAQMAANILCNNEQANMYFSEMADSARDDMMGTIHDDHGPSVEELHDQGLCGCFKKKKNEELRSQSRESLL